MLGPFECQGCLCEGETHFCEIVHAGAAPVPPPGPPPEPACVDDAGPSYCKPLPPACAGTPTCACVNTLGCDCAVTGGGVTVTCYFP